MKLTRDETRVVDSVREKILLEADAGVVCPCCLGNVKIYHRFLHSEPVAFLTKLVELFREEQRFYSSREVKDAGAKASTDASYLPLWGLVEKGGRDRYAPTEEGMDFVDGKSVTHRSVWVLSPPMEPIAWSEDMVNIEDAIRDKFEVKRLIE